MKQSRLQLVFLDAATFGDVSFQSFTTHWDCTLYGTSTPVEVLDRLEGTQAVVINKMALDRSVLASPKAKGLRLIVVAATGTDNVDLKAAGRNTPAGCYVAVRRGGLRFRRWKTFSRPPYNHGRENGAMA